jgi:sugar O-acyltransferase (sialic acid O-acetyltransferase NeuD family)
MSAYTFLGSGHPALAMYMEILYSLHGTDFVASIIRNMQMEDDTPYQIEGVDCENIFHTDWQPAPGDRYILGVNKPESKVGVYHFFQKQFGIGVARYETLVDASAIIASSARLSAGVVINPGVIIAAFAKLEEMVSVNRQVSIGHHTTIGRFSTIQPGVNIAGMCHIGSNVMIGMGANIIDGITIGENTTIGAGSVVTRDIPAHVVAYGVPAVVVREKEMRK